MASPTITIRFEPVVEEAGGQVVAASIEGVTHAPHRLWYRVPTDHVVDDLARAHAFAVSVIGQAMAIGRDLVVDGPITHGLAANLHDYQRVFACWLPRRFRAVEVRGQAFVDDEPYRARRGAILPFSGGLDSAFSAMTLAADGELAALVTIAGLDVPLADVGRWTNIVAGMRETARSLDRPLLVAATNWQQVMPRLPGHQGYFAPTVAVPILLASRYAGAAVPASWAYDRLSFPCETTPLTDPLLGRPGFPVRHHGAWARRIDKVAAVATWPEGLRHLRPCNGYGPDGRACGTCRKCVQTALLFAGLGMPVPPALGGRTPSVEDVERLELTAYALVSFEEAVAAARERGVRDPWVAAVERRLAAHGGEPAAVGEVDRMRRRLRHLLGGGARTRVGRALRRVARALRGQTGPPDLPPLPRWPFGAAPAACAAPGLLPDGATFATTARGRRIYVDPDDWRGASLVAGHGDLAPATLRIWKALVASRPWTHVVDVGANYGEMLVDLDVAPDARVIAIEPDARVRRHLERSLREAGLSVEVVAKAVSDQDGRLPMTFDRTWSGLSSVSVDPAETAHHRLETLEVETITLRALLADAVPERERRVLVKIDVEGHEPAVLRGLDGAAARYADFAALVEIIHLSAEDLRTLLTSFTAELFDARTGASAGAPIDEPDRLLARLREVDVHRHDAVLRPRAPSRAPDDARVGR